MTTTAKTGLERLAEAVRTKRTATLAWIDEDGSRQAVPACLVGEAPAEDGFWAEVPDAPRGLIQRCLEGEAHLMMGIGSESHPPIFFETSSIRCCRRLLSPPRLLLAYPPYVEVMERRRRGGRELVPEGMHVAATICPVARPEEPLAGQVCDLSGGGAGIWCRACRACRALRAGDGALVTIHAQDMVTALRSQVVAIRADRGGVMRLGVRFLTDGPSDAGALAALEPLLSKLREVGVVRQLQEKLRVRV